MSAHFPLRRASRVALLVAGVALVAFFAWSLWAPAGQQEVACLVTVPRGDSVGEVAGELGDLGLIRSPAAFQLAAYATGKWRRLQAGVYELTPRMSTLEILDALCRGRLKASRLVIIPEGYTIAQIARQLDRAGALAAEEFTAVAESGGIAVDPGFPLPKGSLEGYLFPDTYRIDLSESAQEVAAQMLRRFREVVWQGLLHGKAPPGGLHQTIILASLVEAEAKHDRERPVIAGVLANRLRRGMRLECDATIQYALGEDRKARLTHQDLQVDSEYNTYRHESLPPGPICSPGLPSIKAAMDPAQVPYLYYVARPDGTHLFSTTYAEHQAAIARARRGRG